MLSFVYCTSMDLIKLIQKIINDTRLGAKTEELVINTVKVSNTIIVCIYNSFYIFSNEKL